MNQLMRRCAIALATCLILTCGVLAYAEVIPQSIQEEEQDDSVMDVQEEPVEPVMDVQDEEPVVDDVTEEEEYTESEVAFTDDDMMILPRPSKDGSIFIEWNTKEDGTGFGYKPGELVNPENIELYAIWADAELSIDEATASEATVSEATVVEAAYDEELQEEIVETDDEKLQEEIVETDDEELQEEIIVTEDEVLQQEVIETEETELQDGETEE